MRKAKSGVSELMRDFTLKGGWDTRHTQEAFGPVAELILLFSDTKHAPNIGCWLGTQCSHQDKGESARAEMQ